MSDIKISELTQAAEISGDELIIISQSDGNGGWVSVNTTLSALSALYGGVTVLPVGQDIDSITEPGLYICQGAATIGESYNLHYPGGVYPGTRVPMVVGNLGPITEGANPVITQTMYFAQTKNNPTPYSRMRETGEAFSTWTQSVSQAVFNSTAMQQLNFSQLGLQLQNCGGGISSVYPFKTPVDDGSGPNILTAPSDKPGMHLSLQDPNSKSVEGTYRGNVIIADSDGRIFTNVDNTIPTDNDNPAGVDWREIVTVEMNSLKAINKPTDADGMIVAVNKVIDTLRTAKVILPFDDATEVVSVDEPDVLEHGESYDVKLGVLPIQNNGIYLKSKDDDLLSVPSGLITASGTETVDGVEVSTFTFTVTNPLSTGAGEIYVSATPDFEELLTTLYITVA